jgi:hypothetical protein
MTTEFNSIIIKDDTEWFMVIPLDQKACTHYGKPIHHWCITWKRSTSFYRHFHLWYYTVIFITHKISGNRWVMLINDNDGEIQVCYDKLPDNIESQLKDRSSNEVLDGRITVEKFVNDSGLTVDSIKELLYTNDVISIVRKARTEGLDPLDIHKVLVTNPDKQDTKKSLWRME